MSSKNLNEILADCGDVVDFLRNQQVGPNVYPGVPAEYSNWRVELRALQPVVPHGRFGSHRP